MEYINWCQGRTSRGCRDWPTSASWSIEKRAVKDHRVSKVWPATCSRSPATWTRTVWSRGGRSTWRACRKCCRRCWRGTLLRCTTSPPTWREWASASPGRSARASSSSISTGKQADWPKGLLSLGGWFFSVISGYFPWRSGAFSLF